MESIINLIYTVRPDPPLGRPTFVLVTCHGKVILLRMEGYLIHNYTASHLVFGCLDSLLLGQRSPELTVRNNIEVPS